MPHEWVIASLKEREEAAEVDADPWIEYIELAMDCKWDGRSLSIESFGFLGNDVPVNRIQKIIEREYKKAGYSILFVHDTRTEHNSETSPVPLIK